jgi:peptidyl-prolyl cis-trans isomerase SurA
MADLSKVSFYSVFICLCIPSLLFGQSKNDKTVVGKVGDQKITYGELMENFNAGAQEAATLQDVEDFLPIYLDYKAKLLAARDNGYYQDSTLKAEHEVYVKQAAYAYWLEKQIKPKAFEEFKKRSSVELKAFHILIALDKNASRQQIDDAITKLKLAKAAIEQGVPLDKVNEKYSSTRNGRSMGGDIPWISAGRTVPEFEDAVYGLKVGEISEPFRTQFGYHIVLLQDKRKRTPARLVNHIYVRATGDSTSYDKIYEAYNELEAGEPWNEVLRNYSEDGASARNNGKIGWVSYQENFAMDFVEAVMKTDPSLDYSEPVKTVYGYHIFKIDSVETYASEAEYDKVLMDKLKNTPYYKENNQFVVNYLEDTFGKEFINDALTTYKRWITKFDSVNLEKLTSPTVINQEQVYEFDGKLFTIKDYHTFLQNKFPNRVTNSYRESWFNDFKNYVVDNQLIPLTIKTYPEFKKQSDSYLNGLVVYNINEDHVWSAATVDSTRLQTMYEKDGEKYQYPKRPFYYLITARKDSTLDKAVAFMKAGGSPDSLKAHIEHIGVSVDSTSGYSQEPFDRLEEMKANSFSDRFEYNNLKGIFWVKEWLPARKMTFDEAFNRLLSEFQPIREKEWIAQLHSQYQIKVYPKKLKKAFNKDS